MLQHKLYYTEARSPWLWFILSSLFHCYRVSCISYKNIVYPIFILLLYDLQERYTVQPTQCLFKIYESNYLRRM